MIGQRHYAITRSTGDRTQVWRGHANRHTNPWSFDLSQARSYRKAGDALSAARQIEVEPGTRLEVVELNTVIRCVVSYVETGKIVENLPEAP
jgi:hypothetical protein